MTQAITGAVGLDGRVYRAGDEAEFRAALERTTRTVDLAQLEQDGHLTGYAKGGQATDEGEGEVTKKSGKKSGKK